MKIRVRLNESPSKKEGKSGTIAAAGGLLAGASMKALPKRKGIGVPRLRI